MSLPTLVCSVYEILYAALNIIEERCGRTCFPFAIILGFACLLYGCFLIQIEPKKTLDNSLQALLVVLAPTRSAWPLAYSVLGDDAKNKGCNIIQISLPQLFNDVSAGIVELRDPQHDLCDLFRGQLQAYGWSIRLEVKCTDWITVTRWISNFTFRALMLSSSLQVKSWFSVNDPSSYATKLGPSWLDSPSLAYPHCPNCSGRLLYLDCVAYGQLESTIRTLQAAMSPGDSYTLEFTTLGPSVKFPDSQFVLCAIPFLPRRHVQSQEIPQRTPAVLFISLRHVIELVASGPFPLTVDIVRNVSAKSATVLDSAVYELEIDRRTRNTFVDRWGADCWREHMLLCTWESSLLKTGLLMRWIAVVHK